MKKILSLLILITLSLQTFSQTPAENGSIKYKMEITGVDDPQVAQMFKDANMEIGFMNGQYRMDMAMPMMHTRSYSVGDSMLMLMDMMGNKMMMMVSKDEANSRKLEETFYEVTQTKETKKIAGYDATKYVVKTKDNQTFIVYATDKLPMKLAEYTPYTKIKGALLEYEMTQGPYKMKMTATEVKTGGENVEQYKYSTDGYTRTSMSQMKGMMGGQKSDSKEHGHEGHNHDH